MCSGKCGRIPKARYNRSPYETNFYCQACEAWIPQNMIVPSRPHCPCCGHKIRMRNKGKSRKRREQRLKKELAKIMEERRQEG